MALDDRTTQATLTPERRRELLRAFADRMLLKVTTMDDPEDLPGVEKAVRVAAVIERLYSRCDRAEHQAPDQRKAEAERATHEEAAIKARVSLASTLEWESKRRRDLGQWWEAARTTAQYQARASAPKAIATPAAPAAAAPERPKPDTQKVTYVDYTDCIEQARAELALRKQSAAALADGSKKHPPP